MSFSLENAVVIGNEFALSFSDGLELYLDLSLMRRGCPCASCQGEPDALGRVVKPKVEYGPRSFDLVKFEQVGGYALQPYWGDGHSSGIYSYAYLQKLADIQSA